MIDFSLPIIVALEQDLSRNVFRMEFEAKYLYCSDVNNIFKHFILTRMHGNDICHQCDDDGNIMNTSLKVQTNWDRLK